MNLRAKKSWGQNFLRDASVLHAIAEATGCGPDVRVLEIGAGRGALTQALLACGGEVWAVERDRDLVPVLRAECVSPKLTILEANALTLDYAALAHELGGTLTVAGNLPYQIGGRILVNLADDVRHIRQAVVMVQLEVAERLRAQPGTKTYGLLSVLVQRAFRVQVLRRVPPGAFVPAPKVTSAVVVMEPVVAPLSVERDRQLVTAAKAAFHSRRKTLRNSLCAATRLPAAVVEQAIAAAGLSPSVRSETLHIAEFAQLGVSLDAVWPQTSGLP